VLGPTNPGVKESTPKPGGTLASVQTSYIELAVVQDPTTPPAWVDITLSYGFKTLGGGPDSVGHIKTRLSNLRPTLAAGPCVVIPKDIIFVLDSSHSMSNVYGPGTRASEVRAISDLFIDQVSVSPAANHIAVIEFNGSPTVLSGFSSSTVALHGVMAGYNWRNAFSTQFSPALGAALTVFGGPSGRPGIEKVVIFMTDGDVNAPDNPGKAKAAADVLKAAGVQLYTVGIASPPPPAVNLLTSMATSAAYYNDAASATDLQAIMAGLAISLGC
jgi:hypothetical protein